MNNKSSFITLVGVSLLAACSLARSSDVVSIVRILANPTNYDKKTVIVAGVTRLSPEDRWMLYLDCGSAAGNIVANGLAIAVPEHSELEKVLLSRQMKYVLVRGEFSAAPTLPWDSAGRLENVDEKIKTFPLLRDLEKPEKDISCQK